MLCQEREVAILPEKWRRNDKGVHIRPTWGRGRLKVEIVPVELGKIIPEESIKGVLQQVCNLCPFQADCNPTYITIESSLSTQHVIARNPVSRAKDYRTKNWECPLKDKVIPLSEFIQAK